MNVFELGSFMRIVHLDNVGAVVQVHVAAP